MKWFWVVALLLFALIGFLSYAGWTITCPYCHNSDANVNGNCVLKQSGGTCTEDYHRPHYNVSNCGYCAGEGQMSRLSAWLD